eukprot:4601211-Pyramimonas_sp.AAC.1
MSVRVTERGVTEAERTSTARSSVPRLKAGTEPRTSMITQFLPPSSVRTTLAELPAIIPMFEFQNLRQRATAVGENPSRSQAYGRKA